MVQQHYLVIETAYLFGSKGYQDKGSDNVFTTTDPKYLELSSEFYDKDDLEEGPISEENLAGKDGLTNIVYLYNVKKVSLIKAAKINKTLKKYKKIFK